MLPFEACDVDAFAAIAKDNRYQELNSVRIYIKDKNLLPVGALIDNGEFTFLDFWLAPYLMSVGYRLPGDNKDLVRKARFKQERFSRDWVRIEEDEFAALYGRLVPLILESLNR